MTERLKFPSPYFGGKARIASLVWQRLGDVSNFIEPFVGSGAVLLARPHPPRVETINDIDCHVANVWRALQHDPDGVAAFADDVVSEVDLHARHRFLVGVERPEPTIPERFAADPLAREAYLAGSLGEHRTYAAAFRQRMRQDPEHYDVRMAGWYLWGLSCWIGGGWCHTPETAEWEQRPFLNNRGCGMGVHLKGGGLSQQVPGMIGGKDARGVHSQVPDLPDGGRPQLADAYSRGRGVHNDNHLSQQVPFIGGGYHQYGQGVHVGNPAVLGTCEQRRAWLVAWFGLLRDRLRTVRVCAGHWLRVCESDSVTTRLGLTGVFLDAPYRTHLADGTANRAAGLYASDGAEDLVDEVIAWCLERGGNPLMRIAVCGYAGEGYEALLKQGWEEVAWKSQGGYANRNKGNKNRNRERIFFSPHCCRAEQPSLFDGVVDGAGTD